MGRIDVDAMLDEISPQHFDEWMAADAVGQMVGLEKLYQMLSLIGSVLVNSWGGDTKPEDFIPKPPADVQQQIADEEQHVSPNQMVAVFALAAAGAGMGVGWNGEGK